MARPIPFVKIQGLGNDYLFLDGIAGSLPPETAIPALAVAMSDRHFGVGADGIITLQRGGKAPLRMRIWNADGSEGEMCGNGMRGFAKLAYQRGYVDETEFPVETGAGIVVPRVYPEGGQVSRVRVDMGVPRLRRGQIPMAGAADSECLGQMVEVDGTAVEITAVSMGNPHAVVFIPDTEAAPVRTLGPMLERHPLFPRRVNVEFVQVQDHGELRMRVWERGSGETLACGTGACAAVVAAARTGRAGRRAVVHLPGGDLEIEWASDDHVLMTGPTVEVFAGTYHFG